MSSNNVSFPAPVGGVPFERDFGPSILFACLFAALVFVAIFRFARSATRTTVVVGTFAFAVERYVSFSLHIVQRCLTSEFRCYQSCDLVFTSKAVQKYLRRP